VGLGLGLGGGRGRGNGSMRTESWVVRVRTENWVMRKAVLQYGGTCTSIVH
jgi:hypothetical protein